MKKINDKLFSWASIIDENTLAQARTTSELSFVQPHLALMPDAHFGLGSTVGSVIPTVGAIMPAAIGVDIGCGMIGVKTQFKKADLPANLKPLRHSIERGIPVNKGGYNRTFTPSAESRIAKLEAKANKDYAQIDRNWHYQLGSLGSGNHFIELVYDEQTFIWAFLHSGSRGIGNKIAQYHIRIAQKLIKQQAIKLADPDLAYLNEDTPEFADYIADMQWAQAFALFNREEMMDRVIKDVAHFLDQPIKELERINCHHNFTQAEEHFGQKVWLTRKGAIEAQDGQLALIPGSMGTPSYVVEGRGNPEAFNSAPHGAGRVYSRSQAKRTFTLDNLAEAMQGIEYRHGTQFLDEIPGAYKDIDQVMQDAEDLAVIKHTLRQLLNVKGD